MIRFPSALLWAALLAWVPAVARTMVKRGLKTPGTITFVGNVGEGGLGDLRGLTHLFNEEM
jgi:hypothetical protein